MVTYGPWQDSRLHEEIIDLKVTADGAASYTALGDAPTARSGWRGDFHHGFTTQGTGTGVFEQGIDDPPAAQPDLSETGFLAALNEPVGDSAATLQFNMNQAGENRFLNPPPRWVQDQQWNMSGSTFRFWYDRALEGSTGTALYAVPVGFDPFTDEYYVELEGGGAYRPLEIVSAVVLPPAGGILPLFVKDADPDVAEPFLYSAVVSGGPASSISAARDFPIVPPSGLPLNHEAMNTLVRSRDPVIIDDWKVDGRMPTLAALYAGPTLNVATLGGTVGYDETFEGVRVALHITYRWPRWRQVFYEDTAVPYRRVYPRDDGLAGGAPRNYPSSKARQTSNRTSGYL